MNSIRPPFSSRKGEGRPTPHPPPPPPFVTGDILGNFRVRISDSLGKKALKIIFEILFWLETSGNDHLRVRRRGCKCPCPQINAPFYFAKMPFYSQNSIFNILKLHYYFPEMSFSFLQLLFCFQEALFNFSKMPFFPVDYTFSSSCSER